MSETRKIAAILVSDVVGYSRLAGADEDRTLARLRSLRSDLIDPTISPWPHCIAEPIRVYSLQVGAPAGDKPAIPAAFAAPDPRRRVAGLLIPIAAGGWFLNQNRGLPRVQDDRSVEGVQRVFSTLSTVFTRLYRRRGCPSSERRDAHVAADWHPSPCALITDVASLNRRLLAHLGDCGR